jgi:hypothetical protein
MVEVKTHRDHPASMSDRVTRRSRNSGDAQHADAVVKGDKGTITNIHNTRNQQYGEGHPGEPGITGERRGPAAPVIGGLGKDVS